MKNYVFFEKDCLFINTELGAIKLPAYAKKSAERFRFNLDKKELEVQCITCGNWYKIARLKGFGWKDIYLKHEICVTKKNTVGKTCIKCLEMENKDIKVFLINKFITGEFREVKDINDIKSDGDYIVDKKDIELWRRIKLTMGNTKKELKYSDKYNKQDETYKTICPDSIDGKRVEALNVLNQSDAALVSYILSFRDEEFLTDKIIRICFSDFVKLEKVEKIEDTYREIEEEFLRISEVKSTGLIKNGGKYDDGSITMNYFQCIDFYTIEEGEEYAYIEVGDALHKLVINNYAAK